MAPCRVQTNVTSYHLRMAEVLSQQPDGASSAQPGKPWPKPKGPARSQSTARKSLGSSWGSSTSVTSGKRRNWA
jgi:hypothetical protein